MQESLSIALYQLIIKFRGSKNIFGIFKLNIILNKLTLLKRAFF